MANWVRNSAGVKDGADCYRTIKGVRWFWWPDGNVKYLRSHGIRMRQMSGEVFMHPDDYERAAKLFDDKMANKTGDE